jgi:GNAT superfamily N-acetyltransferase
MDELPGSIALFSCRSGQKCTARLVRLTRQLAATRIDGQWWAIKAKAGASPDDEDDHHWPWRKLVGQHRNDLTWEFVGAQTDDGEIQGAIAYRIDFKSFLVPALTSVYVDRLAAAPRNRPWLVADPLYRGAGKGLLLRAVCHSYLLGLSGRVNLVSVPRERTRRFYERRGFVAVREDEEECIEYELSDQAAQRWLQEEGYL